MPARRLDDADYATRPIADLDGTVHDHGERSTYVCHGCRCERCTRANTEYSIELYWRSTRRNRTRRRRLEGEFGDFWHFFYER